MIQFHSQGRPVGLGWGEHYRKPRSQGFRDTSDIDLRSLIEEIESGREWREVVTSRYGDTNPWLHRIITDASRTAFFDTVVPTTPGPALDIGSGWGQTARPLAARRPVVALEPVAERIAFIQAAARQDGVHNNLAYVEADYLELEFSCRFDLICAIGVLEWVGAFQNQVDPQRRQRDFLAKIRRELSPVGVLVLGIENRLGLKYLLGCPDDHIGIPHVACLPAETARQRWAAQGHVLQSFTYSQTELVSLLHEAGFTSIEFFAAFPDYKLPSQIIPLADQGQALDAWLLNEGAPPDHNGYDGSPLNATMLENLRSSYHRLARAGLARHFVPSYFVRAH